VYKYFVIVIVFICLFFAKLLLFSTAIKNLPKIIKYFINFGGFLVPKIKKGYFWWLLLAGENKPYFLHLFFSG
jgi:hypothetical protein